MKIAYIIPSVRPDAGLEICLKSILRQSIEPSEILVVLNCGRERTSSLQELPVRVLTLGKNIGYTAACNLGITSTTAPLVALINDDVELPEMWAETLLDRFNRSDELGAATGVTVDGSGKVICAGSRWNKRFQAVETSERDEVEFLNFAAVLFRRETLTACRFLPARYFAYYDDVDTTMRMESLHYTTAVNENLKVLHNPSSSAGALGRHRWFLLLRNRYWTLCRHFGPGFIIRHLPHVLHGDLILWKKLFPRIDLILFAYLQVLFYPRIIHD